MRFEKKTFGLGSLVLMASATLLAASVVGCADGADDGGDDDDGGETNEPSVCERAAELCGAGEGEAGACAGEAAAFSLCIVNAGDCSSETVLNCVPDDGTGTGGQSGQSCVGDESACVGTSSMDLCIDGTFQTIACSDVASYYGFTSLGCSADYCQLGEPNDGYCLHAMDVYCGCAAAADAPCSDDDALDAYLGCHINEDTFGGFVSCLGNYDPSTVGECVTAFETCQG